MEEKVWGFKTIMATKKVQFDVLVDTREKAGIWTFAGEESVVKVTNSKLDTGDYTIDGMKDLLCIERKRTTSEVAENITTKRWKDCVGRITKFKHKFILLEFSLKDVMTFPLNSGIPPRKWPYLRVTPGFILHELTELQTKHGIHVIYCGTGEYAQKAAVSIMKQVYVAEGGK